MRNALYKSTTTICLWAWHDGDVAWALKFQSAYRQFDLQPFHIHVTALGKLFTYVSASRFGTSQRPVMLFSWEGTCGPGVA